MSPRTPFGGPADPAGSVPWLAPLLLTALAYFLAGDAALLLAIPPGYASPIYPSAGIALAAVLVYGRRVLPGVMLGAYLVNLHSAGARDPTALNLLLPLVSAAGAAAQAALGAVLMRHRLQGPLLLAEPRQVAGFFLWGALIACLVNASVSTLALTWVGAVPASAVATTWRTWWAGDTLGVLIGAPIALTLIGRPRADWAPRRVPLGLPLLAATGLLVLATLLVARWDVDREHSVFERDAAASGAALAAQLQQAEFALEAVHGLMIGSEQVTAQELHRVVQPWLALPLQLQAIGVSQRVTRADLAGFEAEQSRLSGRPFRVFNRPAQALSASAADDEEVVAIRMIEPLAGNAGALGVNALSIPAARTAILRAASSGVATASAGFSLTQEPGQQVGVVVYQALYRGEPAADQRRQAFEGVVFVTLRMQQSADAGLRGAAPYLRWCLIDIQPDAATRRLAGAPGCEQAAALPLQHETPIQLGGQRWLLRIDAEPGAVPDVGRGNAWLFSTVGLMSAAMLAALLLTMTGRARRIEAAVDERTADLQREAADRRRTEAALRESEQRVRSIFEHAPIGIAYADLQGRLLEANPRLRELSGHDAASLAQRSITELVHADDRAELERSLQRLLAGGGPEVQRAVRLQNADGRWVWVRISWRVLQDGEGQPQRLVAVIEDITEQLRRQEAELGRQRAESANLAKSEFLSRMSHELRTPLNAILGFAQLLDLDEQPRLAASQQAWVTQILQAGWHLLEMINDTLDLSRIESGMLRLQPVPVALAPLVQQCVAMLAPAAARRGVSLRLDLADDAGLALGDETRVKQVLTNLLSNAIKYNLQDGDVLLRSRRLDEKWLELRVTDTGPGLDAAQLAALFQPFNRLGRESGNIEGTGIGLVISRRLAELMDGTLEAQSPPGQGATFVLRLPLATGLEAAALAAPSTDSVPGGLRRRVHYVEDNEMNVELMRGILAQRPQLTLAVSTLGLDGLAAIRANRPDLILLDMHLPDIDGLELLQRLQRDPACADIPVMVVSADATLMRIEQALAAGARRYLTKPLNLAEFLAAVDLLLDGPDHRFN